MRRVQKQTLALSIAYLRANKIHSCNCFAVFVSTHIESLNVTRVVINNGRPFEYFLGNVPFVFSRQVDTPFHLFFSISNKQQLRIEMKEENSHTETSNTIISPAKDGDALKQIDNRMNR